MLVGSAVDYQRTRVSVPAQTPIATVPAPVVVVVVVVVVGHCITHRCTLLVVA
jgi:hypothetical protein